MWSARSSDKAKHFRVALFSKDTFGMLSGKDCEVGATSPSDSGTTRSLRLSAVGFLENPPSAAASDEAAAGADSGERRLDLVVIVSCPSDSVLADALVHISGAEQRPLIGVDADCSGNSVFWWPGCVPAAAETCKDIASTPHKDGCNDMLREVGKRYRIMELTKSRLLHDVRGGWLNKDAHVELPKARAKGLGIRLPRSILEIGARLRSNSAVALRKSK